MRVPNVRSYSAPCAQFQGMVELLLNVYMVRPKIGLTWKDGVAKHHLTFSRNSSDGRNGARSTPKNTVAIVASVALYSITSNAGASTTI